MKGMTFFVRKGGQYIKGKDEGKSQKANGKWQKGENTDQKAKGKGQKEEPESPGSASED